MHRIKYVHKTATNQMPMQAKAGRSTALSVGSLSALGGGNRHEAVMWPMLWRGGVTYWYLLVGTVSVLCILYCVRMLWLFNALCSLNRVVVGNAQL